MIKPKKKNDKGKLSFGSTHIYIYWREGLQNFWLVEGF